jgi:transposase
MEVLHGRCAGLDVHKDSVVACARIVSESGLSQQVQTFSTTTTGLMALSDWLAEQGCTHVVMEATGVYWKPVWHILEESFELVLANAMHVRNVPGRKTDVNDATWLADLLAHGLVRGSFVPPTSIQEVRTLTRTRKQLVREKSQHVQRLQKTLEDANIKLDSVVSDVMGMTGRTILNALSEGEADPKTLAGMARGNLRAKRHLLEEALRGRVTRHHRFLLKLHLDQVAAIEQAISTVEVELGSLLEPFRGKVERLITMPGVSGVVAQVTISEIGLDMGRFPTVGHLISWAGFCPRNDESAGKRRSSRVRKGAPWLKTTLVQAAWAAVRMKGTYLRAQFLRIKSRRGPKKAILAVAASMLTAIYYMLRDDVDYRELGDNYFDRLDKKKAITRLTRRLEQLGYAVELRPAG